MKKNILGKLALVSTVAVLAIIVYGVLATDPPAAFNQPYYEVSPNDYPGISKTNVPAALNEANTQLSQMNIGGVCTVQNFDNLTSGKLMLGVSMGNVVYWMLSDGIVTIHMDAYTNEIIIYSKVNKTVGPSKTQAQILNSVPTIAAQFHALPNDRESATIRSQTVSKRLTYNVDNNSTSTTEKTYWITRYNRTKSGIVASDHIEVWTFPDGNVSFYYKNWYMGLSTFSTVYSLTQNNANGVALNFATENSTVIQSFKMIVRPNDFWTSIDDNNSDNGNLTYGTSPKCVWEVWVMTPSYDLWIIQVDGNNGNIIGGDMIEEYYANT